MELQEVEVPVLPPARLEPVIGSDRLRELEDGAAVARGVLGGRRVWNVSSTASGGGVAEMLQVLVGYANGAGVDCRWLVIGGDPDFYAVTKRIHNRLHGSAGDGGPLGDGERRHYTEVSEANARLLLERMEPGDVALLHDPQTAGLAAPLRDAGMQVVWRCHIGLDHGNERTEEAWAFLRPMVETAPVVVFSRRGYVPDWVPDSRVAIIPPSIDPLSPKNQDLDPATCRGVMARMGLAGSGDGPTRFLRRDGTEGHVEREAEVIGDGPLDDGVPLVVQVSRWDRLKDMEGVLAGFAEHVVGRCPGQLALVGPAVAGVGDDPEGAQVLDECRTRWEALPAEARAAVRLVVLPMDDVDENAAMVNAIQRSAAVVVQKSLAEGFGLTVAEAMWKGRPMVASAVGGIIDQVAPGTGILLDDPTDLDGLGAALVRLLEQPAEARRLGDAARAHVQEHFVGDRHLLRYVALLSRLVAR